MSLNVGSGVSRQLFASYILGGRLWPQLRGGINLCIINTLAQGSEFPSQLTEFEGSRFSEKQVDSARMIMVQDHAKGGIKIQKLPSDAMMLNEWTKAKAGVFFSLHKYMNPTERCELMFDEIEANANRIIAEASVCLSKDESRATFANTSGQVYEVFRGHTDLAKLFVIASFWAHQREASYLAQQVDIDATQRKYGISESVVDDAGAVRVRCCNIFTNLIQSRLIDKNVGWLTWGFNPKGKS